MTLLCDGTSLKSTKRKRSFKRRRNKQRLTTGMGSGPTCTHLLDPHLQHLCVVCQISQPSIHSFLSVLICTFLTPVLPTACERNIHGWWDTIESARPCISQWGHTHSVNEEKVTQSSLRTLKMTLLYWGKFGSRVDSSWHRKDYSAMAKPRLEKGHLETMQMKTFTCVPCQAIHWDWWVTCTLHLYTLTKQGSWPVSLRMYNFKDTSIDLWNNILYLYFNNISNIIDT